MRLGIQSKMESLNTSKSGIVVMVGKLVKSNKRTSKNYRSGGSLVEKVLD